MDTHTLEHNDKYKYNKTKPYNTIKTLVSRTVVDYLVVESEVRGHTDRLQ